MKKFIVLVLILVISLGVIASANNCSMASTASSFKDVPKDAWYYEHVEFVSKDPRQIMVGYNGIFGPSEYLTVEQFIKILVHAADEKVVNRAGEYWADVYIQKGLDLGYVKKGEFPDYKRAITRAEMAKMMIRALPSITGEKNIYYELESIKNQMVDYDIIKTEFRDYVCQAYQLGILTGGTDGRFNPDGELTRASAAVVVNLMLNPEKRRAMNNGTSTDEYWSDAEFEDYVRTHDVSLCIAKIEDRKIYWKSYKDPTPTLINDPDIPYINEILYDYVKHMLYSSIKNSNYFTMTYDDDMLTFDYRVENRSSIYGDIHLFIFSEPYYNSAAERHMPGKQNNPSKYEWVLAKLRDDSFLEAQGWKPGMSIEVRKNFKWTQEKYEKVFKQACIDIYGPQQGAAFYDFVMKEYMETYLAGGKIEDSYFGLVPNAGVELAYYYSDKNQEKLNAFWTTVPTRWK